MWHILPSSSCAPRHPSHLDFLTRHRQISSLGNASPSQSMTHRNSSSSPGAAAAVAGGGGASGRSRFAGGASSPRPRMPRPLTELPDCVFSDGREGYVGGPASAILVSPGDAGRVSGTFCPPLALGSPVDGPMSPSAVESKGLPASAAGAVDSSSCSLPGGCQVPAPLSPSPAHGKGEIEGLAPVSPDGFLATPFGLQQVLTAVRTVPLHPRDSKDTEQSDILREQVCVCVEVWGMQDSTSWL